MLESLITKLYYINDGVIMDTLALSTLRRILKYNEKNGRWDWTNRGGNSRCGLSAGSIGKDGNLWISINGKKYLASKLAILYVTGKYPKHRVIFKDSNKLNLRYPNLQELIPKISKIPQITWSARKQKWKASIRHKGKIINVGWFGSEKNAIEARRETNFHLGFTENEDHAELRTIRISIEFVHDETIVRKMGKYAELGDTSLGQTILLEDVLDELSDKQVLSLVASANNLSVLLLTHEFKFSYKLLTWQY